MSSHNDEWKREYLSFKKGEGPTNNRNLYIDSVVEHYGSDYSKVFNKKIYEVIIEEDSFFANISSEDAAEVLKTTDNLNKDKQATVLRKAFKCNTKFKFDDSREVRPKYKDVSLDGKFGLLKPFKNK